MTPLQRYQLELKCSEFVYDEGQHIVVAELEKLYQQLIIKNRSVRSIAGVKGLYIWGTVGRGKSYLMDLFYHSLPSEFVLRLHFHRFMRRVHTELNVLSGHKNPLKIVAKIFFSEAQVLCFDEFNVTDIGDAVILANLFDALFDLGVTLVANSNISPDKLYKDGLQRQRFLPTIDLLYQNTQVIALDGPIDYRLNPLHPRHDYFTPLSQDSDRRLNAIYTKLSGDIRLVGEAVNPIVINGREIKVRGENKRVIWFDFMALCDGPRSQIDYIEISQDYNTVIISDIPILGGDIAQNKIAIGTEDSMTNNIAFVNRTVNQGHYDDPARRFIALVDEFYDQGIRLIISAAAPIDQLYLGGRVGFEFQRTVSRISQMQSQDYGQNDWRETL